MLKLNKNKEYIGKVITAIKKNNNYCCCQIIRDCDSFCQVSTYENLPEIINENELCGTGKKVGECICKIYLKE